MKLFGCLKCMKEHGLTTELTSYVGTRNIKKCGLCGKRFQQIPTDGAWLLETIKEMASKAVKDGCGTDNPYGHRSYHEYGIMFNPAGRAGCRCTRNAYKFLENVLMLLTEPKKLRKLLRQK